MFGRKAGPGQGYLPGIVLAGTRVWIFGESVLAANRSLFLWLLCCSQLGIISGSLASTTWDRRALFFCGTSQDFPGGSDGKESACNAGDMGLIPGLGKSPGEENGYPLQYFYLENSMDRGAWQATGTHQAPLSMASQTVRHD